MLIPRWVVYRVTVHDALVTIDPESATPVYVQLADILRRGIEDGTYPPNRALPSIRTLQQHTGSRMALFRRPWPF